MWESRQQHAIIDLSDKRPLNHNDKLHLIRYYYQLVKQYCLFSFSKKYDPKLQISSKAFPMNNRSSCLLIFCLGDPHMLKRREGTKNRSSDPRKELPWIRCKHFYSHCWRCKGSDLFGEAFRKTRENSGSPAQNYVVIELLTQINVTLVDWNIYHLMQTRNLFSDHHWVEESFRASTALRNSYNLSIRQFIELIF